MVVGERHVVRGVRDSKERSIVFPDDIAGLVEARNVLAGVEGRKAGLHTESVEDPGETFREVQNAELEAVDLAVRSVYRPGDLEHVDVQPRAGNVERLHVWHHEPLDV